MTYQTAGIAHQPMGNLLTTFANELMPDEMGTTSFEAVSNKILTGLGAPMRKLDTVADEDLVVLEGFDYIGAGTLLFRKYMHLLSRFMAAVSAVSNVPAIIGYRPMAEITFEEGIDAMLTGLVPPPESVLSPNKTHNTVASVATVFTMWVRHLKMTSKVRSVLKSRLRRYAGFVAHKIATHQAITDAERSFFLMMCDPTDPRCWSRGYTGGPIDPSARIAMTDHVEAPVLEAWNMWCAHTVAGPFSNHYVVSSNGNLEQLIYYYGPKPGPMTFNTGFLFRKGMFYGINIVESHATVDWGADMQQAATRERIAGVAHRGIGSMMHLATRTVAPAGLEVMASFDHPDVQILLDQAWDATGRNNIENAALLEGKSTITPIGYRYHSKWRQRDVLSKNGEDPTSFLEEIALHNESYGTGTTSPLSYADLQTVDLELSRPYLGRAYPVQLDKAALEEKIYIPVGPGVVSERTVDMTEHYTTLGQTMFPPAFREYVQLPLSILREENIDAESFIATSLNLTGPRFTQARMCIRYSHNYAKYSRLFGESAMPMNRARLAAYCRKEIGG